MNFYKKLLDRYINNRSSEEELEVFHHLLSKGELDDSLESHMQKSWDEEFEAFEHGQSKANPSYHLWRWGIGLAASVFIAAIGYYFIGKKFQHNDTMVVQKIIPGSNKAILVLANGARISLTDARNGTIAAKRGLSITKTKDGKLVYSLSGLGTDSGAEFNTIETPRGGQYVVNLSDGTVVTLNAESSLRFPAVFSSTERKVELQGEGYFEVAKNKEKPFLVEVQGQKIAVLGTHFNVNAYSNKEEVSTTLLEGAVRVNNKVTLIPGQQALSTVAIINVRNVDPEDAIGWKEGAFIFDAEDFKSSLDMIARWYDVEFVYDFKPGGEHIGGRMSRKRSITEILEFVASTANVSFKIEGRRIRVSK